MNGLAFASVAEQIGETIHVRPRDPKDDGIPVATELTNGLARLQCGGAALAQRQRSLPSESSENVPFGLSPGGLSKKLLKAVRE